MKNSSQSDFPRVALVTGGLKLGGSTTFLYNLGGELIRRKIAAEVFSFELENPLAADFQRAGVPVLCLDERSQIFEDRLTIILQNLARFRPTVVVSSLGAVSFEVLRYLPEGIFRIGVGQSDDANVYDMMRHYTPWMDLAAMVSQTMRDKASAMPEFARVPVAYLPYGVPIIADTELPVRDFTTPLRILYLGRLEREQKRVHLFPEILLQLCAAGIPFHWTIAGAGKDRGFLEANLKTASPHQIVSFAGPIRYADVPTILKQHDIFLLASDYEGLPLSLLEAMGAGLVPVVSDLPSGIPEVVNASNGCLVPVNDLGGYARAIIHLHEHRDELATKSAAARKQVLTEFSVAAMTDRWLHKFPKTPPSDILWPNRWSIKPILVSDQAWRFSPPIRYVRRILAKVCHKN